MAGLTRAEALAQGYTIDNGQRPIAYKGPRFDPTATANVLTEREEEMLSVLRLFLRAGQGNSTDFRLQQDAVVAACAVIAKTVEN